MTTRTARRLAVSLTILYVATEGIGLALQFVTGKPESDVGGLPGKVAWGIVFLAWSCIGGLIAARKPANPIGWVLSGIAFTAGISDLAFGYATYALQAHPGSLPGGAFAALTHETLFFVTELLIVLLFLLFPDGEALSSRWRGVGWVAAGATALIFFGSYATAGAIDTFGIENPYAFLPAFEVLGWVAFGLLFAAILASIVALVLRLRRANGDLRQQMRWFVYASAFLPVSFAFFFFGLNRTTDLIGAALLGIAVAGMPIAAAIAIFKYRLYDIDVVIRKTLVAGVLAAFATLVYLVIVVGVGTIIVGRGGKPSVALSVVATAIVALAFQPVRLRARRWANHAVYGRRATPYDALSDFSDRLTDAFAGQDLLPEMARIVAQATGAPRANVWLRVGDTLRTAGTWPADARSGPPVALSGGTLPAIAGADITVAVRHSGELLGALTVTKKAGEPPTPIEEKLVVDLAAQAGLVLSNARLIEELRASRQRLVAAQDQERRRIERNLHDGAQQQLIALSLKERLAESLMETDTAGARAMMADIRAETAEAIDTLRDLARGIYPPLLADQGLPAALRAQAKRAALPVAVEADGVGRFDQEVEAAAYFCCLEALQNVAKYANASRATVRLAASDGRLTLEVADDGIGFDASRAREGTGLQGMTDRLEALGGRLDVRSRPGQGTTISGEIPLETAIAVDQPVDKTPTIEVRGAETGRDVVAEGLR